MSGLNLSSENLGVLKDLLMSEKTHAVILNFIECLENTSEISNSIVVIDESVERKNALSVCVSGKKFKKKKPQKVKIIREKLVISSAKFDEPNKYYTVVDSAEANKEKLTRYATRAEKKLLYFLKSDSLDYEFQKIFYYDSSYFIADFYLPKYKIVIEVDGGYHNTTEQNILDENRTNILKSICGVKSVIRFSNEDVNNKRKVLDAIQLEINILNTF